MNDVSQAVRSGSRMGTILGILTIVLGVLAMSSPLQSGVAVATIVGILMIVGGIARSIFAFSAASLGQGLISFLFGGLALLCGLVMVGRPLFGLASLTLFLAAYFLAEGVFEIIAGFKLKGQPGANWLIFGGVASFVLGFLIWRQWPISGAWAIGLLLGIRLFMAGWQMVVLGAIGRGVAREIEAEAA